MQIASRRVETVESHEPRAQGQRPRGVWLLIGGQAASSIGDGAYAVALPWFVLGHGGSAATLGVVLGAYGVARAAAMPFGGALCDRRGARNVLLVVDFVRTGLVGALALVAWLGSPAVLVLAVISALIGACQGAFVPGSFALMPSITDERDLQRANAGLTGALQAGSLVGPLVGATLITTVGAAGAFALDAATFGLSALSLVRLRSATPAASSGDVNPPTLKAIVAATPALPIMFIVVLAGNLATGGIFAVALPVLAHEHFGASGLGGILAALAAGAVGGTAVAAGIRARRPAVLAVLVFLGQAAALALLPYLGGVTGAAVAAVAFGFTNAVGELIIVTAIQRAFPSAVLGRTMGLLMFASTGAFPISVALIALAVDHAGAAAAFPIAAAFSAAALLFGLSRTEFRRFGAVEA